MVMGLQLNRVRFLVLLWQLKKLWINRKSVIVNMPNFITFVL